MRNNYIYISLVSLFLTFNVIGQEKKLARADKEFKELSYIDAREIYIKVVEKGYQSQDVFQKIADSYYFNAELGKAVVWYEKLYNEYKTTIDSEYIFRYSQCLKNIEEYEKSDEIMQAFHEASGKNQKRSELFNEERNYLELIAVQSGRFKIQNLTNINSGGSDFGPSFYKNESIVFTSSRGSVASKVIHEWNEQEFFDLYSTDRVSPQSYNVQGIDRLNSKVNSKLHESTSTFSKDGNTMYFTRNNFTKNRKKTNEDGTILLKLYKAVKKESGKWGNVVELPFNGDTFSVAHPALSPDNKKLYFSSDRPGTKGASDIYVVDILGDNKYSEPLNLGETINTEGRETFPFVSESGQLFFASDGHVGLGGLDVFLSLPNISKTEENMELFDEPYNVGGPVNTPDDDFAFIIDERTKIGYFSSNRGGGIGSDDIYSFKQTKDLITRCVQTLSGVITNAETREVLPDAIVILFDDNMKKITSTTTDANGEYDFTVKCDHKYVVRAQKEDYKSTEVDLWTNNQFEFKNDLPIQLTFGGQLLGVVPTTLGDDLAKILQLQPIYFDLDKSFIRPDAEPELQKVIAAMTEYPELKIDVRSHTDSRQSQVYNKNLSDRRAKSTVKYIVEKGGIDASRLTGEGYGEIELINKCSDGVECSEEEHQLNRRSEFIIVK